MLLKNLRPAENIDPQNFKQIKEELEFLLDGRFRKDIAAMIGKGETAFSKYLSGEDPVTANIINEVRTIYRHIFEARNKSLAKVKGDNDPNIIDPETEYNPPKSPVEIMLAGIDKKLDTVIANQEAEALKKKNKPSRAKRKPPESPSGEEKNPEKD